MRISGEKIFDWVMGAMVLMALALVLAVGIAEFYLEYISGGC